MVDIKHIINKLLVNSGKITPDEAVEIQKVANKYPFFQQAYLFRTLFLKRSGSFYKTALQETAARTTDRRRLYEIIELGEISQTPKQKSVEKKENNNTPKKIAVEIDLQKPEIKKESGIVSEKKKKESKKKLNKPVTNTDTKKKKNKKLTEDKKEIKNKKLFQSQKKTGKESKNKKKELETEKSTQKMSYLEWLKQVNSAKKQENKEIFDAIDKFLKERPKIVPKKENNLETPAIIEKGIEEKQSLMTETLANLYVKQKKYDKAIQAFKILSLKYPKKSSYFANRIKELKQKLK